MNQTPDKKALDAQEQHWDKKFSGKADMFGESPSYAAANAVGLFRDAGITDILELGSGQGRDTILFAQNSLHVTSIDYSALGVDAIAQKAERKGLSQFITTGCHDVRKSLKYGDETFGGCFSHMLYSMAFTTRELASLSKEIWRILKPDGLNIYTVRHSGDPHYGTGAHMGEGMYEINGFITHFFDREKVLSLAEGFEILSIDEFEEHTLPRRLFQVTLKKI